MAGWWIARIARNWDAYVLLPHPGAITWVVILSAVLLLGAIEGSYRLDRQRRGEKAQFVEDRRRIEGEVTHRGVMDIPHQLGHSAQLWGLRLRNVGALIVRVVAEARDDGIEAFPSGSEIDNCGEYGDYSSRKNYARFSTANMAFCRNLTHPLDLVVQRAK